MRCINFISTNTFLYFLQHTACVVKEDYKRIFMTNIKNSMFKFNKILLKIICLYDRDNHDDDDDVVVGSKLIYKKQSIHNVPIAKYFDILCLVDDFSHKN